jgi:hypothetical protein
LFFGYTGILPLFGGMYLIQKKLNQLASTVHITPPNIFIIPIPLNLRKVLGFRLASKKAINILAWIVGGCVGIGMVLSFSFQHSAFSITFPVFIAWGISAIIGAFRMHVVNLRMTRYLQANKKISAEEYYINPTQLRFYASLVVLYGILSVTFGLYGLLAHGFLIEIGKFRI